MDTNRQQTLYQRIGGYDVIANIIDDLNSRNRNDPRLARFATRSDDSRKRARQLFVDQMCALAGGPCVYIGRDMKTSHAGLGITEAEWAANMENTAAALKKCRVPQPEADEFLAIFEQYRIDVVEGNER